MTLKISGILLLLASTQRASTFQLASDDVIDDGTNGESDKPECGKPEVPPNENSRIIGGEEAKRHSWPWQCWLNAKYRNHAGEDKQMNCGAVVVSVHLVVTAAHCMFGMETSARLPNSAFTVVCGLHQKVGMFNLRWQERYANETSVHEKYNANSKDNDIAMIRVSERFKFNKRVRPVCLPAQTVPEKTMCFVTGWGATSDGGDKQYSNSLLQVRVPIMSTAYCQRRGHATDNMICAGYPEGGKDSCSGDSGGPLVCKVNDVWELNGIVSHGRGCGQATNPGVYTKVSAYKDWIERRTSQDRAGNMRPGSAWMLLLLLLLSAVITGRFHRH